MYLYKSSQQLKFTEEEALAGVLGCPFGLFSVDKGSCLYAVELSRGLSTEEVALLRKKGLEFFKEYKH